VRTDIPIADQIVQVGHACLEAGFNFQKPHETIHLIVLSVESENQLQAALQKISLCGIEFTLFCEPDDNMGFTSACTQPLPSAYRREFRSFPLWEVREVIET
jgi:hypothetical protein